MHDQTAQVDDLRLVATPSALNCADLFVRFTLMEWQVPSMQGEVSDTAKALVQVVVGSVVEGAPLSMMTVRLRLRANVLAIEVEDHRVAPPLTLPRALSRVKSGIEALPGGRQLLWCELPLPTGMDATVVPLPRRGTTKAAAVQNADGDDPEDVDSETMQRILNALRRDPFKPPE